MCMVQILMFKCLSFQECDLYMTTRPRDSLNMEVSLMIFGIGLLVITFEFAILILMQKSMDCHKKFFI